MTSPIFVKQTPATLETVMKQNLYRAIEDDNVTLAEHYLLQLYTHRCDISLAALLRYASRFRQERCCTYFSQLLLTASNIEPDAYAG